MSIEICGYRFKGPYELDTGTGSLKNRSGVYVILDHNSSGESWKVIDVGESSNIQDRVEDHDRRDCWYRQRCSYLEIAVYYCRESERMRVEQRVRNKYNPPCGKQ